MVEVVVATIVVMIVVAGVVIYLGLLLFNPTGPVVAGPCRLVTRTFLRDYCSGACPAGQICTPATTRRYLLLGTQPATCACGTVVPAATGGITPPPVTGGIGSIAPITGSTVIPPTSGETEDECPCTQAEEDAEFQQMIGFYSTAVQNARGPGGYQAANDPNYSDPGLGFHRVGNCADWRQVSWAALVTRTWRCWKIEKIRARQHWTIFGFHHFVKLESCRGRVVYLDPWSTGNPDVAEAADFSFQDGNGWAHTTTHTHEAGDAPRDPGND